MPAIGNRRGCSIIEVTRPLASAVSDISPLFTKYRDAEGIIGVGGGENVGLGFETIEVLQPVTRSIKVAYTLDVKRFLVDMS